MSLILFQQPRGFGFVHACISTGEFRKMNALIRRAELTCAPYVIAGLSGMAVPCHGDHAPEHHSLAQILATTS
jgi:hypothetical protein